MTAARRTAEPEDPFRIGWRYVTRRRKDGRNETVMVPLTAEDWLHPQFGDVFVNNNGHALDCHYLTAVFRARCPGGLVLSDHRVEWDRPGLTYHSPDVVVIPGVRPRPEAETPPTFDVAVEGVRPVLIAEVTSPDPDTRRHDLHTKRRAYYRAGVEFYVIVDELPTRRRGAGGPRQLRLLGYERGPRGYVRMQPDRRGWLWLGPVGVWIGIEGSRVWCYERDGRRIEDAPELEQARRQAEEGRQQAEDRLREEAAARHRAEERVRQLEAELRRRAGQEG